MKKIGKEALYISTTKENPRNGESTFVRLLDGGIMHAFTEYYSGSWLDHATARISAVVSYDEGESWGEKFVLLEMDTNDLNNMSPSLFRMKNGNLGLVYLRKAEKDSNSVICMPMFRASEDEGKTWSEAVPCTEHEGYYCAINDVITETKSGRIYVPASYHGTIYHPAGGSFEKAEGNRENAVIRIFYTDDCVTWILARVRYNHLFMIGWASQSPVFLSLMMEGCGAGSGQHTDFNTKPFNAMTEKRGLHLNRISVSLPPMPRCV